MQNREIDIGIAAEDFQRRLARCFDVSATRHHMGVRDDVTGAIDEEARSRFVSPLRSRAGNPRLGGLRRLLFLQNRWGRTETLRSLEGLLRGRRTALLQQESTFLQQAMGGSSLTGEASIDDGQGFVIVATFPQSGG